MKTAQFKVNDEVIILASENTFAVGERALVKEVHENPCDGENVYEVDVIGEEWCEGVYESELTPAASAVRGVVINAVAKAYAENSQFHKGVKGLKDAITLGAQWADSHPQYPWIKVDHRLPGEGQVVFIAVRDKTGFGVNVATYEKGVFNSYSTDTPDYWMPVPALKEV
jgi:hypothetical protein